MIRAFPRLRTRVLLESLWKPGHTPRASNPTGGVVEWSIAPVLKTGEPKGSVGSNPTPSAICWDCSSWCVPVRSHGVLCVVGFGRCRMVSHRESLVCQESVRSPRKKLSRMRVNLNPRRPHAASQVEAQSAWSNFRENRFSRRMRDRLMVIIKDFWKIPLPDELFRYSSGIRLGRRRSSLSYGNSARDVVLWKCEAISWQTVSPIHLPTFAPDTPTSSIPAT